MKTIFITGGAQGIGLATARHFALQGWFVGLYDLNTQGLNTLLDSGEFPNACGAHCDVTQRESIEGALRHFAEHTDGKLDVLLNNAGVLTAGKFEDIAPEAHDLMIDVNVKGFTHVAQAGFPWLKSTSGAVMVNLCSASSIHGIPGLAVYSSSKFYVNGLTQALNIEWAEHDIRVTCVKPPVVNTAMGNMLRAETAHKNTSDMQPEEVAQAIQNAVEGKRVGYVLGTSTGIWALLDKLLPESARRKLTLYLVGS
ncbi:MAG: NAD(P)-dependent dehydrogenase (short-subunit alcohol dehydrogenase family) [Halioglobus sp.]